jgi:hypothetical protein
MGNNGVRVESGFNWFSVRPNGWCCEHGDGHIFYHAHYVKVSSLRGPATQRKESMPVTLLKSLWHIYYSVRPTTL